MLSMMELAEPLLSQESSPYVVVALQECQRMNVLLTEVRRSLVELDKGKHCPFFFYLLFLFLFLFLYFKDYHPSPTPYPLSTIDPFVPTSTPCILAHSVLTSSLPSPILSLLTLHLSHPINVSLNFIVYLLI